MKEQYEKKEKIYKGVIIGLALIIVIGFAFCASELKGCKVEKVVKAELTTITMSDLNGLLSGKEVSVIYLAKDTCGYCQQQKPDLIDVMTEYNVKVNYLDVSKLTEKEADTLYGKYGSKQEADFSLDGIRTPTMLYVAEGKVKHMTLGVVSKDKLVETFKEYGLIVEKEK